MKSKIFFSAVLIILLGLMSNINAQPFKGPLMDKLNLTDKQITEIEKLRDDHLKKMSDFRNEIEKISIDLRSEWRKSVPDKKKIEALQDKMNEVRNKMQKQRLNHWFDIYNLLDEKQKEKFREFRSEFFKDGKFWGPKFRKDYFPRKPGYGRGLGPCGMGYGPRWDK